VQAGGDLGGESNEALRLVMRQEMAALAALTDASCKEALRQVIREEMSTLVKDAFAKHIPTLTVDSACMTHLWCFILWVIQLKAS
jgi:hypothetical protein